MSKSDYPVTTAIRFLRAHGIDFEPKLYEYVEHGGTAQSALCLGVDEHHVVKTIVLQNEQKKGMIVLMHGDKQISTRNLARELGMKHIEPADPKQANKWTGFLVGGTSPFGTKTVLPVYVEHTVWDLDTIYINGGKRGFLVAVSPEALKALNPQSVNVATDA
ncbi:Cys-tRNA(Pro) deacylase [Neisseria weaveri]|uniref:Cys-tRNA(Pro)/Cys-tRNA(Cys) deacylase n=1 Tax=Neisseria weaveri TaxID=28091 RepID=A0A448VQD1_9NEIS|nr:Cys-tRNA(Pro) deacylase [Neisseria weaveri]EGV35593.1 YbaK/ebsC protein [Neisseria weaveri LMG 5135]EGV38157.1 YbaK/ebsC protein [Neisseria weaveri ATCC 51223]SAY50604.1 YbaK/prolyl-tRNA synthetase associated domain-containing protein [Neisseria weaveri]VEJ52015.1 YbaK/prolyl-tRNA synthetase associated domain-containing protein [Neisseria weaveri]